jgi:putative endopeptidase
MMTSRLFAALLLGTATVTLGPVACKQASTESAAAPKAGTQAGIQTSWMDKSVKPGDDFYAYANGGWMKTAEIPADRSSVGSHYMAFLTTEKQQQDLLAGINKASPAPGSNDARIKDYYSAYMNTAAIDAAGLTPLKPDLDRYAAITDKAALVQVLGDQTESDLDLFNNNNDMATENLFGLFITKALTSDEVVPYLFQGGLGLPDRDYYVSSDAKLVDARTKYKAYIGNLLTAAGISDAQARADRIFALETKIAQAHATKAETADFVTGGTLWKRADFATKAPGMDWNAYFTAARMPNQQTFDVYSPNSIVGLARLVASEPLDAWKDWLTFHRINANTDVLPGKFDQMHFAFYSTELSGIPQQRPRDKRALAAINSDLGNAFGKAYVDKYFPASSKTQIEDMAVRIKDAFAKRIDALDWMDPATKQEALAKVKGMVVSVGYPDTWLDYSQVKITPDNAYANRMAAIRGRTMQQLAKLGKPQDRGEWWMNPQLVNAVNMPVQNALNFPAAILQKPFFDPAADAAFNYGAIGAVIGHEISHSFDASGAAVDSSGKLRNWWKPADLKHFQQQTQALVDQYNAYEPFPGLHLNGKLELGENGADVAGLAAAYDAYRASLNGKELPVIDGFTGDQRFFIAFAQSWAGKTREAAERQQVISNAHAPEAYRAQTVRNNDAWYKAFDVQPGSMLYLAPDKRVKLW